MTKGPYYIGIGANRCGTSSLHFTLKKHPQLREFRGKELHFWDQKIKRKSISWYLHQFRPIGSQKAGEITPAYYRTPHLPKKLAACLPDVKLLLLLRNPAEALFSDYRRGVHRRSFPEGFEEHVDAYLDGKGSDEPFCTVSGRAGGRVLRPQVLRCSLGTVAQALPQRAALDRPVGEIVGGPWESFGHPVGVPGSAIYLTGIPSRPRPPTKTHVVSGQGETTGTFPSPQREIIYPPRREI